MHLYIFIVSLLCHKTKQKTNIMKKLLLVLAVSVTLFSCQKEVITPNQPTPATTSVSAYGDWHLYNTVNGGVVTDWNPLENTINFSQTLITSYYNGNVITEDIVWLDSYTYVMSNTITVNVTTLTSSVMIVEYDFNNTHTTESFQR